jgi:threonine aldolase
MANIPGIAVNLESVQTNIVYFSFTPDAKLTPKEMAARLLQRGVHIGWGRVVTHCQVDDADIETTLAALNEVMRG